MRAYLFWILRSPFGRARPLSVLRATAVGLRGLRSPFGRARPLSVLRATARRLVGLRSRRAGASSLRPKSDGGGVAGVSSEH